MKYLKRTSFDLIDYDAFMAGETKVIHSMLTQGDLFAVGWVRVLSLIAHWVGKTKNSPIRG